MKLSDFLTSVPKPSAPAEQVEFWVLHRNKETLVETPVKAFAAFKLVSEKDEQVADLAAMADLQAAQGKGGLVPSDLPGALGRAHFLEAALRDHGNPVERFATAAELQASVPRRELVRLMAAYGEWADKHYPKIITKEDRDGLKAEAKGK